MKCRWSFGLFRSRASSTALSGSPTIFKLGTLYQQDSLRNRCSLEEKDACRGALRRRGVPMPSRGRHLIMSRSPHICFLEDDFSHMRTSLPKTEAAPGEGRLVGLVSYGGSFYAGEGSEASQKRNPPQTTMKPSSANTNCPFVTIISLLNSGIPLNQHYPTSSLS